MKRSASGRYVGYGGMDHPEYGEAKEVGIFDTVTGTARRIPLPTRRASKDCSCTPAPPNQPEDSTHLFTHLNQRETMVADENLRATSSCGICYL